MPHLGDTCNFCFGGGGILICSLFPETAGTPRGAVVRGGLHRKMGRGWPLLQRATQLPPPDPCSQIVPMSCPRGGGYFEQYFGHSLFSFRILPSVFRVLGAVRRDGSSCVEHTFVPYFPVHNLRSQPCSRGLPPRTLYPHVTHIMNYHSFRQRGGKLVVSKATGHPRVGALAWPGRDGQWRGAGRPEQR